MKEKIIQLRKVNFISMIFTPLLFLACMLPYAVLTNENIKENFSWFTLIFLAVGGISRLCYSRNNSCGLLRSI